MRVLQLYITLISLCFISSSCANLREKDLKTIVVEWESETLQEVKRQDSLCESDLTTLFALNKASRLQDRYNLIDMLNSKKILKNNLFILEVVLSGYRTRLTNLVIWKTDDNKLHIYACNFDVDNLEWRLSQEEIFEELDLNSDLVKPRSCNFFFNARISLVTMTLIKDLEKQDIEVRVFDRNISPESELYNLLKVLYSLN